MGLAVCLLCEKEQELAFFEGRSGQIILEPQNVKIINKSCSNAPFRHKMIQFYCFGQKVTLKNWKDNNSPLMIQVLQI
jgi:hypothetical protein